MKYLYLLLLVSGLAYGQGNTTYLCRVDSSGSGPRVVTCDEAAKGSLPVSKPTTTYSTITERTYYGGAVGQGGSTTSRVAQEERQRVADHIYKDYGGYRPGYQVYKGKGYHGWYRSEDR
jgi:hypothetical protein